MITLRSRREIERMRDAGRIVAAAHRLVRSLIRPGITTGEIDAAVADLFEQQGVEPLFRGVVGAAGVPFPAVTCISVNDEVVHGIPGSRKLVEGDIVSVDTGCRLAGWCGDSAWSYPVGQVSEVRQRLLEVGERTLQVAIDGLGRCGRWSEIAAGMERTVKEAGFSVVEEFVGHGIGREMHEDPQVPNFVSSQVRRHDFRIEPGLVLAIEPMVNEGSRGVRVLDDHWTVVTRDRKASVHFEHTVAVTADGPEILTRQED